MCSLFEDHIIANFCQLDGSSAYPETLLVTEDKQYRPRGLTHIEDSAYEFFLKLDELRVEYLNDRKLKQHKGNLIDDALAAIKTNELLKGKRLSRFPGNILQNSQVRGCRCNAL